MVVVYNSVQGVTSTEVLMVGPNQVSVPTLQSMAL